MPEARIQFSSRPAARVGVLIVFCGEGLRFGASARAAMGDQAVLVSRAATAEGFKGKSGSALEVLAARNGDLSRIIVLGVGNARELEPRDFVRLGGAATGK